MTEASEAPRPAVAAGAKTAPRARLSRWHRALAAVVIVYGVLIVVLWAWMTWRGDRGWLATLVLFGPRWVCGLPWPLLVIASAIWVRRLLWVLALIGLFIVGPLMGFTIPLPSVDSHPASLRVLTCNVNKDAIKTDSLSALIDREQPDIVALQEVYGQTQFIWPPAWHVINRDELTLASRWPIVERQHFKRAVAWPEICAIRFTVELPGGEMQVFVLHLESPRPGLEAVLNRKTGIDPSQAPVLADVLARRASEAEGASAWIMGFPGPKIVLGDFNAPADSAVFRPCWSALSNAFSKAGWGFGFTKISEKQGWSYGARIDHVLHSPDLRCRRAWVGPDVGSDHLPLLADF